MISTSTASRHRLAAAALALGCAVAAACGTDPAGDVGGAATTVAAPRALTVATLHGEPGCELPAPPTKSEATEAHGQANAAAPALPTVAPGSLTVQTRTGDTEIGFVYAGLPAGFDHDLAREIAARLGLAFELRSSLRLDDTLAALDAGRADIAVAAVPATPEVAASYDLTAPYLDQRLAVVADSREQRNLRIDRLDRPVRLAVVDGEIGSSFVTSSCTGVEVLTFGRMLDALTALAASQADAAVVEFPPMHWAYPAGMHGPLYPVQVFPTGVQYAVAVPKNRPDVRQAIDDALAGIKADDTWARLFQHWIKGNLPGDVPRDPFLPTAPPDRSPYE